jgi:light-harvesting protein B-800-850 alpha chain
MQTPFHGSPWAYAQVAKEQDYKFWLVVNPSTWLMPIFIALVVLAIAVHTVAFSIPGRAWTNHKAPVAAVAAPAAVEAPAAG